MKNFKKSRKEPKKQIDIEALFERFREMSDCFSYNDTLEQLILQANPTLNGNCNDELSPDEVNLIAAAGDQAVPNQVHMEKKHDH